MSIFSEILDIIFPPYCCICRREGDILCNKCSQKFEIITDFYCQKCMRPQIINHQCENKFYDGGGVAFVVLKHIPEISKFISAFKYKFNFGLKEEFEKIVSIYLEKNKISFPENTVIAYVPITKRRVFWRGFNQSYHLATIVSEKMKVPLVDIFKKIKHTKAQAKLKREQRLTNLSGVFEVINKDLLDDINDVIIIDDITTTGSTLKECIDILKLEIDHDIRIHTFVISHGTK